MSKKRLIASFAAVVALLVVAGVLELLLLLFPAAPGQGAGQRAGEESVLSLVPVAAAEQVEAIPAEGEVRAAELVKEGGVVVDGEPLRRELSGSLIEGAKPFASEVEYIDQLGVLPSGCEVVALAVALRAEGFDASPADIADRYLHYGDDFSVDYVGSPRRYGGGFPHCIVQAANAWLAANAADGSAARAYDLTGTSFSGIVELVVLGYPVLVWTTEGMASPLPQGEEVNGLQWYDPEHCVVVCDVEDEEVVVADSLAGLVSRDRVAFERIYENCGNLAAIVVQEL